MTIEATCTGSNGGAQKYTLSLVRGWSAVVATVASTSGSNGALEFTVHGGEAPSRYALEVQ